MTIQDVINHIMKSPDNPSVIKSMLESLQTADNPDWTKEVDADAAHVLAGSKVYINNVLTTGTCEYDAKTSDADAVAADVLTGKTAYVNGAKITGTCDYDAKTSDADATASDVLRDKTAYVNGVKVTGTCDYNAVVPTIPSGTEWAAAANIASGKSAIILVDGVWTLVQGTYVPA